MAITKTRSIKFNFIMNLILTVSSIIFPLITSPYISEVLKVAKNGQLSFAVSTLSYFSIIASLGIPTYGIRVCAQVRDDKSELTKTVQELLIINLISTAITYAAFFLALFTIPLFQQNKELFLINSISLILNTVGVNWFYSSLEKYSYITIRSLIFKVISIGLMFLLVHQEADYLVYAAVTVFAAGGSNVMNFLYLRKFVSLRPVGNYEFKKHLKPIFLFFGSAVASSVYTTLDVVMLGFLSNDIQLGFYNVATKVKGLLTTLVTSLGAVLLPRLSYYVKMGKEKEFKTITTKAFNFIIIFALSLVAYFTVFANETIMVLNSPLFLEAAIPLRLILPAVLFIGLSYVTGLQILIPMMMEKKMMISYIAASVVSITVNFLLMPVWGASGAALTATLAELTVLSIQCCFIMPLLKDVFRKIQLWKIIFSLGTGIAFSVFVKYLLSHFCGLRSVGRLDSVLMMIISAIVFWGIDFLLLLLTKERFVIENVLPPIKFILKKVLRRSF